MITPGIVKAKDALLEIMGRKFDDLEGIQENLFKRGLVVWEDSNGWTDEDENGEHIFIAWEEGPFEWVFRTALNDEVCDALYPMGYFVEIICGWGLIGIYPS